MVFLPVGRLSLHLSDMAKKTNRRQSEESTLNVISEARKLVRCGDCAKAYDFCRKAYDGTPILCRCRLDKKPFFRLCSSLACDDSFDKSSKPFNGDVPYGFVGKDVFDNSDKVVPLFRKGESSPFKVLPRKDVPIGGISSEMYY